MRPAKDEYAAYYETYVSLVPEEDVLTAMEKQAADMQRLLAGLDDTRAAWRYAEGKWSVKEVVGHVIDAERVFAYRALSFARGDKQPLPGFEQDEWMPNAAFDDWRIGELAEHYALVRRANLLMFRNLSPAAWDRRGTASDNAVTVRGLASIIVGHDRHHARVLRERYLVQL